MTSPYNKYRATKTVIDGRTFASKKEGARYLELKLLLKAGKIENLRFQVPYLLMVNGQSVGTYVSDFNYMECGREVVEDVKGFVTPEYRLKKKLMKAIYNIEILET